MQLRKVDMVFHTNSIGCWTLYYFASVFIKIFRNQVISWPTGERCKQWRSYYSYIKSSPL